MFRKKMVNNMYKSGTSKSKNYFKQIVVPFIIYADTECNFKKIHINNKDKNTLHTEKYQNHIFCGFSYKLVCTDDKFSKSVVLYRGKTSIYKLVEAIPEEYDCCKQIIKKHFNKNLIMSVEDEKRFQSNNKKNNNKTNNKNK